MVPAFAGTTQESFDLVGSSSSSLAARFPGPHAKPPLTPAGDPDDLRASRLPLRPRPPAGPDQAVRHDHAAAVGKARDPPGRLLDDPGRRIEPRPDLFPEMGITRRARGEDGQVRGRPGVAFGARQDRGERPARRLDHQLVPDPDQLLFGEIAAKPPHAVMAGLDLAIHEKRSWIPGTSPEMTLLSTED